MATIKLTHRTSKFPSTIFSSFFYNPINRLQTKVIFLAGSRNRILPLGWFFCQRLEARCPLCFRDSVLKLKRFVAFVWAWAATTVVAIHSMDKRSFHQRRHRRRQIEKTDGIGKNKSKTFGGIKKLYPSSSPSVYFSFFLFRAYGKKIARQFFFRENHRENKDSVRNVDF